MARVADKFRTEVSTWAELAELVEHFSLFSGHAWLFRGVTDEKHGLVPKVGRPQTRAKKKIKGRKVRVPYRLEDERAIFEMFKQQARSHLSPAPQKPLEWLAIAQHFGMPTRLLDWTESLLVATWFAVERGGADRDAALWVSRGIETIPLDFDGDPFALNKPKCYRPPHITARISTQASVFVICPKPTREVELPFIRKIIIKKDAQFTIKKRLNACGINRRNLFPDLSGLSDHLAWMYKHDWLAGYRPSAMTATERSSSLDETD